MTEAKRFGLSGASDKDVGIARVFGGSLENEVVAVSLHAGRRYELRFA